MGAHLLRQLVVHPDVHYITRLAFFVQRFAFDDIHVLRDTVDVNQLGVAQVITAFGGGLEHQPTAGHLCDKQAQGQTDLAGEGVSNILGGLFGILQGKRDTGGGEDVNGCGKGGPAGIGAEVIQLLGQDHPVDGLGKEIRVGHQPNSQDNVEQSQQSQAQVVALALQDELDGAKKLEKRPQEL